MAISGQLNQENDNFNLTVTNGNVEQLRELANFLVSEGLISADATDDKKIEEVIKIGISWLERIRNQSNK